MPQLNTLQLIAANVATLLAVEPERRSEPDGADVSRYQGIIDWAKYIAHPYQPQYAIIRATIGRSYIDPMFQRNREACAWLGVPRAYYYVIRPDEPVEPQIEWYYRTIADDPPEGPHIGDHELHLGLPPHRLRTSLLAADRQAKQVIPGVHWVYSARWYLDGYVTTDGVVPAEFKQIWWHLAQYLTARYEHPGPVALPRGVPRERVVMHQTSDRLYGKQFGMGSEQMDYNRLLIGQVSDWFSGQPAQPPTLEPIQAGLCYRLTRPVLNFRVMPNTNADVLTVLSQGSVLEVEDVGGSSAWIRATVNGRTGWAAVEHGGVRYLERV